MRTHGIDKHAAILLVDDSPGILALLKDLLVHRGFRNVRTAGSAEEGLKAIDEIHPEVIFLDLMMPDTSGVEFTKQALEKAPATKIVLTTALPATHEAVTMAVSQGAAEYLPKPLREDSLAAVLDHLDRDFGFAHEEDIGYG